MAQDRVEQGRKLLLKGLDLLVGVNWGEEPSGQADFTPPVEAFTGALADRPLPPRTLAMLMHYYERIGAFAKAEDALFGLLDAAPGIGGGACAGPGAQSGCFDYEAPLWEKVAGVAGLEPVTSAVTGQRSNQLSYTPATKGPGVWR